jgi:nucleoid-associated protein YgaU
LISIWPSNVPQKLVEMTSTNLSSPRKQHVHTQVSLRKPLRCGFTVLLCSCLLFGAAQCRAQETQDAAEAARQERARKEQERRPKHVYTEEDLGRAKILTPDDEARFAAQRRQPLAAPELQQAPLDASTDLPQLPLGDVARRYRDAKLAMQAPTPFHLPFDEPVFAAPLALLPYVAPPRPSFSPVRPSLASAHPHAAVPPSISNPEPLHRVDPFTRRSAPAAPSSVTQVPGAPAAQQALRGAVSIVGNPQPNLVPSTSSKIAPPKLASRKFAPLAAQPNIAPPVAPPAAPQLSVAPAIAPLASIATMPSSPLRTVIVQPGDSLWKLAKQNLGRGSRWQELLTANPSIVDPTRLAAGTEIIVPAQTTGLKADVKVIVQQGDSLTKLALVTYGRAAAWRCIAQANPEISDVNRIYAGQQLLLPFACQP